MGLNPFRPQTNRSQTKTRFDIAMVMGALLLTGAVILWALFGN